MNEADKQPDSLAECITSKRTETLFNVILAIVGTGLTILTIAWLMFQIKAMWKP